MSTDYSNISRIPLKLSFNTNTLTGELIRHLSPLTIKKLIENFPLQNRINNYNNKFVYIKVELDIGTEKGTSNFKKGDIAYSPSGGFISIFLENFVHNQKFNHIGKIVEGNLENFLRTNPGDYLLIEKDV